MILALLLGAALGAPAQAADVADVAATAWVEPDAVAIGEPFTLTLDVVHPGGQRVLLDPPPEGAGDDFGDRWVVVEPRRVVRLPLEDGSGRVLTQARWRLFGLEPGEHELLTVGGDAFAPGAVARVEPVAVTQRVRAELAEGEDAPRPTVGFREPPAPAPRRWRGVLLGGLGLVVAAAAGLVGFALVRVGRRAAGPRPATPLERLAALDPNDDGARRALYFEASRLVRAALDEVAGVSLEGRTDEEWALAQRERARLSQELVTRAADLLRSCAEVKYAAATPTRFAAEALLAEARELLGQATTAARAGEARR